MELAIIRNIEKYFSFIKNMESEYVVKTEIEQFNSLSISIIFNGETVGKNHPFFNRSTIQQKIQFKDFIDDNGLRNKIRRVQSIRDALLTESESFKQKAIEIISSGQTPNTLLENKTSDLLDEMFKEKFNAAEFKTNHLYIESRLSEENKAKLITLYEDFIKMKHQEFSKLDSVLN